VGVREVKDLILRDKVRCVLGSYSSAVAVASNRSARNIKSSISPPSATRKISPRLIFSPYTFQVVPNSYMQAKAVVLGVAQLAKKKGWKEYVTIASDYEWGRSTQESTINS